MSKHNLLLKKIQKQILSINNLIESNFHKLRYFKSNYKKILLSKDNRLFLVVGILVILTLSYFLIPTFYNKDIIQTQIKNQISKNYNMDIKFNEKINYGLLPGPHFYSKNLSILRENKEIGNVKNLKVFFKVSQFFSINKIFIKNLVFDRTDFNIYSKDFVFFKNLLKTEPHENEIYFKKSNIFFKNKEEQVMFINKIDIGQFYYDSNNLLNVLSTKNEIFNVPFKLIIKNDKFNKEVSAKFKSKKIRLNLDTKLNYDNESSRSGLLDILFLNKNTSLNYVIKKNSLSFTSNDNRIYYKGIMDFKPFYLDVDFAYKGLNLKNLFNNKSIFIDLINSEILNNKNLNAVFNIKVEDITNISEFNNLDFKISIEQGDIFFSNSTIMWKDDLKITLNESSLNVNDDGINLAGSIKLNFKDINNFYSSFQIPKKNRKDINNIEVDFIYNFNNKNVKFENPIINNSRNLNLEEFLNNFNRKKVRTFNKITFKNFINNFFGNYVG